MAKEPSGAVTDEEYVSERSPEVAGVQRVLQNCVPPPPPVSATPPPQHHRHVT
jgi:hypothetical protein